MKKQTLIYSEVDHNWFESDSTTYGISNNDSKYLPPNKREKSWSVISKTTQKTLFTGKTKKSCIEWIEKKTSKKVIFRS